MSLQRIREDFDVYRVPLEDTNLIEASAGTGKTHSVALLALRLILEKEIGVEQILMVTFTIDAAAEMNVRVRKFLRDANNYLRAAAGDADSGVRKIIEEYVKQGDRGERSARALGIVQQALLDFDKASIFTIHGFCARMLAEYAFESKQVFRSKTVEPDAWNQIIDDAFNDAWRNNVTTLPEDVLRVLYGNGFNRERIRKLVQGGVFGQRIFVDGQSIPRVTTIEEWVEWFRNGWPIQPESTEEQAMVKLDEEWMARAINSLAYWIYEQIKTELEERKQKDGLVTFDDMIKSMRDVVCEEAMSGDARLIGLLRQRYQAVFIDEFQDTDPWQFDIFSKVFGGAGSGHVVFYIGDPKQSIYGFRRADLDNYFNALNGVQKIWNMPFNYRSTRAYIEAMNEYFRPAGDSYFDLFHHPQMAYYPVSAPESPMREGGLQYRGVEIEPIRVLWCRDAADLVSRTVALVAHLLHRPKNDGQGYSWSGTYGPSRVEAGQIGILVRTNREGRKIKEFLARRGIPSVVVGDARILESAEALEVYHVLRGIWTMTPGDIRRALITSLGGRFWSELHRFSFDELLDEFRNCQTLWKSDGVYACLHRFLALHGMVSAYLQGALAHSERSVANVFQLMEVLHQVETEKKLSPEELIFWLKRGMEGEQSEENEHLQRIESDESAVKIVTMHSCKGLEYDLVIAPYLDMKATDGFKTARFRMEGSDYISEKKALNKVLIKGNDPLQLSKQQIQAENMRLLYVAMTRARFQTFVLTNSNPRTATSTALATSQGYLLEAYLENNAVEAFRKVGLGTFLTDNEKEKCPWEFFKTDAPEFDPPPKLSVPEATTAPESWLRSIPEMPKIELPDRDWTKLSYSGLSRKLEVTRPVRSDEEGPDAEYDRFIFQHLRSGTQTGIMLHELLERVDFSNPEFWRNSVQHVLKRYPASVRTAETDVMGNMLQMLHVLTNTVLDGRELVLKSVTSGHRLNEAEFYLPLKKMDCAGLLRWADTRNIGLNVPGDGVLEGLLNGVVDLFFEHEGRYYILDWKSDRLGERVVDYEQSNLGQAMVERNYTLQYYLYTLALFRYLKHRRPEFDYERHFGGVYYVFLRGVREGTDEGIFYRKPPLADLLQLEQIMLAGGKMAEV